MHYIRLLKTPRFSAGAGNCAGSVSALITITSDLGDSFLFRDAMISVELSLGNDSLKPSSKLAFREYQWKMGMRTLKIQLDFPSEIKHAETAFLALSGTTDGTAPADDISKPTGNDLEIISAYSPSFGLIDGKEAEKFVQRKFAIGQGEILRIWEETGESIARHIWDGGLALTTYLAQNVGKSVYGIDKLNALHDQLVSNRDLEVLEVGSGCGIVGLALALLHERCHVTLTDLPLAEDLLQKNLQDASLQGKTIFEALDWDQPIPESLVSRHWDIILVADCTYNVASAPALVRVLTNLVGDSLDTVIVLAHKKRHDSEDLFFKLMSTLFRVVDRISFNNGDQETGALVDIYTFRLASKRR